MRNLKRIQMLVGGAVTAAVAIPMVLASLPGGDHGAVATAVAEPVREPCPANTLAVHVGVPSPTDIASHEVATLHVVGGESPLCVLGARTTVVPAGGTADFQVRASSMQLQRIQVGTQVALVRLPPGAALTLLDDPSGWALQAPWLDPLTATAADAFCSRSMTFDSPVCREGYSPAPGSGESPLCSRSSTRGLCVRSAEVRLVREGSGTAPQDRPLASCRNPAPGAAVPLWNLRRWCELHFAPGHCEPGVVCPGLELDPGHGHGRVRLFVGFAERWTVTFDNSGGVEGTALGAPVRSRSE